MVPGLDRLAQHVGDPGRAHFGHQIVGGDLLRRHEQPLLTGVGRLHAAVEEVRDVRVLLRLGGPKHGLAVFGQHLRHDLREHHRPERHGKGKRLVVLRHGNEIDGGSGARVEAVEPVHRQRAHDLAHSVGPVVETEHPVTRPDTRRARDNPRLHELVGLTGVVGATDARDRVGDDLAHAVHHGVVRDFGALPPFVTVHRVVAPHHRRDHRPAAVLGQQVHQLLHERQSRLGRRIASVEPGVYGDRQVVQMAEPDGSLEMVIERVHAAAADQSEQVQRSPAPLHGGAQLHERR